MSTLPADNIKPFLAATTQPATDTPPKAKRGKTVRAPRPDGRDELGEARRRKAEQRAAVMRYVDQRMESMEGPEAYRVPMLYVAITGSLPSACLLQLVCKWSEDAYALTGSAWVRRPVQTWINASGLDEHDWTAAREALRERGFIEERRRYDLEASGLLVEIAFCPSAFADAVAGIREVLRDEAFEHLRRGAQL